MVRESSASEASFGTPTGDDAALCCVCEAEMEGGELACSGCASPMHWRCRNVPVHGPSGRPASALLKLLNATWLRLLCPSCDEGPKTSEPSSQMAQLTESVASLASSVAAQQVQLASLTGALLGPAPPALGPNAVNAKTLGGRGEERPAPGLSSALSSAKEEDLRLRSAVLDGVPFQDGVSDRELLDELFSFLGLERYLRIEDCFRMGKADLACPKLKVVFYNRPMLSSFLAKETRAKLRQEGCPAAFSTAYLNPSRTAEERQRLHLLRRRRDLLNSEIPEEGDQWFLDYARYTLVKKLSGRPDWKGPGDAGFQAWAADQPPPPTQRRSATASTSSASTADPPPAPHASSTAPRQPRQPPKAFAKDNYAHKTNPAKPPHKAHKPTPKGQGN